MQSFRLLERHYYINRSIVGKGDPYQIKFKSLRASTSNNKMTATDVGITRITNKSPSSMFSDIQNRFSTSQDRK